MRHLSLLFAAISLLLMTASVGAADVPDVVDGEMARLAMAQQRVDESRTVMAMLEDKRESIASAIRKETGLVEVGSDVVRRLIANLQEQREQLELDNAGAAGRQEAMEQAVARLSKQLNDRVTSDEVSRELSKVLEIRQSQLQRIKQLVAQNAVAQAEVDAAEMNAATARAELAAARQKALGNSSADALDTWNRQLLELSVSSHERQARLKYVSQRLEKMSGVLNELDALDNIRDELARARQAAAAAVANFQVTRERIDQAMREENQRRIRKTPATQPYPPGRLP